MSSEIRRCGWAGDDPAMIAYHDEEWGVPVRDDPTLFEFLTLEGAQAGLSWRTILHRRSGYREVFDGLDPGRIARWDAERVAAALRDPRIIRNRLKVESTVSNARAFLAVQEELGSFAALQWSFVPHGEPIRNAWRSMGEVPATTPESDALAKELKRRGFRFVGSTICYAHMQATGMVDDHVVDCFRHHVSRTA